MKLTDKQERIKAKANEMVADKFGANAKGTLTFKSFESTLRFSLWILNGHVFSARQLLSMEELKECGCKEESDF